MSEPASYLHEAVDDLTPATLDAHRAYRSLMEELEAIDWYAQRVDAASDDELKAVLAHNGNEEKEHAAMVLEWLRRHDAVLDGHLRTYLFTSRPILEIEESAEPKDGGDDQARDDGGGDLGIRSLRETRV
jgi:hypothetical protein